MQLLPVLEGLHSVETFHPAFLKAFFERLQELEHDPSTVEDALKGQVVATVFEEPSTRTRLSFETAVHRLGGRVITVADPKTTSSAKGESLLDAARVIGGYADLIVWRHASDGASRLAAQYAGVPVVNGGDGRLGHPTQTLLDLYTLYRDWGNFQGKTVAIMGDLANGRTARSLAWGLAIMGARVVLLPAPGLDWEASFETRILDRYGYRLGRVHHELFRQWIGTTEARVLEPRGMAQGSLFSESIPTLRSFDAIYLTRLQDERGGAVDGRFYPGLKAKQMEDPSLENCLLLHPLPRRSELPSELDSDPRAHYFEQARLGPLVRQGVFLTLLKPEWLGLPLLNSLPAGSSEYDLGLCPNEGCITRTEGIRTPWRMEGSKKRRFLCAYCDALLPVDYVGCCSSRRIHPVHSALALQIKPENIRPFILRDDAEKEGYSWGG